MVPNSRENSGHGLPWVGTYLNGAAGQEPQVGACKEVSGGLMCKRKRKKLEILNGSVGTSFLNIFVTYLKLLQLWSCLEAKTGKCLPKINKSPADNWRFPCVHIAGFLHRERATE